MRLFAVAFAATATLLLVACSGGGGDTYVSSSGNAEGVSATGTGRVFGTPDVVVLTLGVNAERTQLEDARAAAANAMTGVISSLKANGVAEKDVQTTQFSVNPMYDYFGRPVSRGYQVSNIVTAKLRKLDEASKAIDAAIKAGGDDAVVQSVQFTIDDPTQLRQAARELAVKRAKSYAEELAKHAGSGIGDAISIAEQPQQVVPVYARTGVPEAASLDAETPIAAGELEVIVTVQVLFALS